jgi:hypothetical protein
LWLRKTWRRDHDAGELPCLFGHQAGLLMACIEEMVHEVGAHGPHPEDYQQRNAASDGWPQPSPPRCV